MAEVFNRTGATPGSSMTAIYTAPNNAATDVAIVLSCNCSNIQGSQYDIDVQVFDGSGNATQYILKNGTIPAGTSLDVIQNKLILKNGESIRALHSNGTGYFDVQVSALEITYSSDA